MRKYLTSAIFGLLALTITLASSGVAHAQAAADSSPATLVLKKVNVEKPLLDNVEKSFAGKDGPTCTDLIQIYNQTLAEQTGVVNESSKIARESLKKLANPTLPPPPADCDLTRFGFEYMIVNFVDWNQPATAQPISKWYLLSPTNPRKPSKFAATAENGVRIFGSKKIAILLVQRGIKKPDVADARYTLTLTHKISAQNADLNSLLSVVFPAPSAANLAAEKKKDEVELETVLAIATNAGSLPHLPDDIALAGQVVLDGTKTAQGGKPDATFTQTYDDEGYAYWDISAAIPITGIKDIQYTQDGSTVTAKTVTRVNAYALAHFYPVPVDLKGKPWQPSLVAGLPLSGAPLDKPFVGLAIGMKKPLPLQVNIFAGAVFNKVFTSASTTDATQLNSHRVTKLLYGIDIPIAQLVKAIAGKN